MTATRIPATVTTPPTAATTLPGGLILGRGRHPMNTTAAPPSANTATTRRLIIVAARNTAGTHGARRGGRDQARGPRDRRADASAGANGNPTARVGAQGA